LSPEISPDMNSTLFTNVVFRRNKKKISISDFNSENFDNNNYVIIRFEVHAVQVPSNYSVRICGEINKFGNWDPMKALEMNDYDYPFWKLNVIVPKNQIPFRYKYIICDEFGKHVMWEDGENRIFRCNRDSSILSSGPFKKYFEWRGTGISIPIFSLRSNNGLGVGEFLDIKLLVDFAVNAGLRIIQILPINDTSVRGDWRDSYPYSSLSVFALHPIYINLDAMTEDPILLKEIQNEKTILNNFSTVEYEKVMNFKMNILKKLFKQSGMKFLNTDSFKKWFEGNERWLVPYALFCVFRDKYKTSDFYTWEGGSLKTISRDKLKQLTDPKSIYFNQVAFYYFVQYNLHLQLLEASNYATTNGVALKGDIAIGVNKKSIDCWVEPHLFRLNKQTGAPPDVFSEEGQNWGFPTYNWDEMSKDDYSWWRLRLTHMSQYFHAFRIDHILGFFRIWEIPGNCITGLLGRFYPSVPVWRDELIRNGIWDINRLCEPYIKTHLIDQIFGIDAEFVKKNCLDEIGDFKFKLKPVYSSEKQIDEAFPINESSNITKEKIEWNRKIRNGLFKFVQNVILLRDEEDPNNKFYPRIDMMKTSSFTEIGDHEKKVLYDIYVDYFYKRQESLWTEVALQRLPVMVHSTKMLCCGEDLGMVPKCVEPVMNQLRILGLRIQRMPSDPKKDFYHPAEYPYLTVCTPSVHDTSTIRGWWEENRDLTQKFYNQILGEYGPAPQFCDVYITTKIIWQHLCSKSMLAIFPIQDLFGLVHRYFENRNPAEERINIPSNPEHYWQYRIHVPLEILIKDTEFTKIIRDMIQYSGRYI
jgi:4-alpha-glucanotransferase